MHRYNLKDHTNKFYDDAQGLIINRDICEAVNLFLVQVSGIDWQAP